MKTDFMTKTETVRTFTLKLNDDELLHLEAALDLYTSSETDKPEGWLGMYEHRYNKNLVWDLHKAVAALREEIPCDI